MLEALILGLIQGITEFIPVSSSGHLVLVPEIFNWEQQTTTFDLILHAGTLLALLITYRKKISEIILHPTKNKNLIINLIIGTIPAGLVAFFFEDRIDETFKSINIVIFMLIIIGVVMVGVDYLKTGPKKYTKLSKRNSLVIGIFQILSLVRGTSRSGMTILGGLSQKMTLKDAADFSFLLSIPLISAAVLMKILDLSANGLGQENLAHLSIGFLSAFISGLFAINFMLSQINKLGLKYFGIYRIILGIILIIAL